MVGVETLKSIQWIFCELKLLADNWEIQLIIGIIAVKLAHKNLQEMALFGDAEGQQYCLSQ